MRAFVALEIPAPLRDSLRCIVADLRQQLPAARWVGSEAYHLTLHFLGDIEGELVTTLDERLSPVFEARAPFEVQLAGGGTFPPGRPARVAWIGVENPMPVIDLASDVHSACAALAQRPERRSFTPHLTLARCRRPWRRSAAETWRSRIGGPTGEPFTVSRGVLMRSTLRPDGARYDVVSEYPLGAG